MNKADFILLIEQPETLGAGHIAALKNITSDFPYFQSAQVLLTKALYNEQHYEFEKQLKHTSLMVPDRAVLFRYIHNMTEAAVHTAPVQELTNTTLVTESEPSLPVIAEPEPKKEISIPQPIDSNEFITEPIEEPAQTPLPETIETASITEDEKTVTPIVDSEMVIVSEIESLAENQLIEPAVDTTETHSFAEWLQLQAAGKIQPNVFYKPNPQNQIDTSAGIEPTAEEPVVETTDTQPASETTETPAEPRSNVVDFESILDKFIRENPRISRGKAEFYSPVNMAKQSVEQDEELVSETLANVYYKQGHYKKAIRVYEKLCLLYPHKLSYFADLIQKIKTENKD